MQDASRSASERGKRNYGAYITFRMTLTIITVLLPLLSLHVYARNRRYTYHGTHQSLQRCQAKVEVLLATLSALDNNVYGYRLWPFLTACRKETNYSFPLQLTGACR